MTTETPLLVVFDIDGTLTASVNVHQIAILRALERFGLQEIDTDWGSYLHFTDSWIFQANFRRAKGRYANEEEFASFEELFEEEYRAASGGAAVDPLPGAVACLEELQERGIPFCFATGSMRSAAEHKLLSFPGIASAPVLATASEGLTREEIVTTAVQKALHHYDHSSFSRIISVGDGLWDAKTAANLQYEFLGIAEAERADVLKAEGARHVIGDFQDESWRVHLLGE